MFLVMDSRIEDRCKRCLGLTGSEIFLVNLSNQGPLLLFSYNYEEIIKHRYLEVRAAKNEQIEIDRFEYASSNLQESQIVVGDSQSEFSAEQSSDNKLVVLHNLFVVMTVNSYTDNANYSSEHETILVHF